ncbi:hypothetical protein WISP_74010 [Willisornis vidua]|uniref:Uncharacterized protein n=1 Tax=Willisornis vidua TaxID=1566151 RepID=A0ABQ9D7Z9_9PASS|nr:hypothetical protein WISP_74010 [Willisornis vidua]
MHVHLLISTLPGELEGDDLTENQPNKRKKWFILSQITFLDRIAYHIPNRLDNLALSAREKSEFDPCMSGHMEIIPLTDEDIPYILLCIF